MKVLLAIVLILISAYAMRLSTSGLPPSRCAKLLNDWCNRDGVAVSDTEQRHRCCSDPMKVFGTTCRGDLGTPVYEQSVYYCEGS